MHSGLLLLLWLTGVAVVQVIPGEVLPGVAGGCLALAFLVAHRRALRLMRRIRVLLAGIVILFGWFTPGELLLVDWPRLSPTREGLVLATVHAARLVAVVAGVVVLLDRLPVDRLVSGLYALARPLGVIGLPAERVALRLLLVLRYVESPDGDGEGARSWRAWLLSDDASDAAGTVRLAREPIGALDLVLGTVLSCALLWWSLS